MGVTYTGLSLSASRLFSPYFYSCCPGEQRPLHQTYQSCSDLLPSLPTPLLKTLCAFRLLLGRGHHPCERVRVSGLSRNLLPRRRSLGPGDLLTFTPLTRSLFGRRRQVRTRAQIRDRGALACVERAKERANVVGRTVTGLGLLV